MAYLEIIGGDDAMPSQEDEHVSIGAMSVKDLALLGLGGAAAYLAYQRFGPHAQLTLLPTVQPAPDASALSPDASAPPPDMSAPPADTGAPSGDSGSISYAPSGAPPAPTAASPAPTPDSSSASAAPNALQLTVLQSLRTKLAASQAKLATLDPASADYAALLKTITLQSSMIAKAEAKFGLPPSTTVAVPAAPAPAASSAPKPATSLQQLAIANTQKLLTANQAKLASLDPSSPSYAALARMIQSQQAAIAKARPAPTVSGIVGAVAKAPAHVVAAGGFGLLSKLGDVLSDLSDALSGRAY